MICNSCGVRVVKELDSKSNGLFPHRFESYPQRSLFFFSLFLSPYYRVTNKISIKHLKRYLVLFDFNYFDCLTKYPVYYFTTPSLPYQMRIPFWYALERIDKLIQTNVGQLLLIREASVINQSKKTSRVIHVSRFRSITSNTPRRVSFLFYTYAQSRVDNVERNKEGEFYH